MARGLPRFLRAAHQAHASKRGTIFLPDDAHGVGVARAQATFAMATCLKMTFGNQHQGICDKASPVVAVMLHLRSCYVSKAAILTIPVQLVPVENRSPA
jgi:hypothetical protein